MSRTFLPWNVDEDWQLPPSVHDLVPPGHLAHFVRNLVREELDLTPILDTYRAGPGAPAFHPAMMTAVLLYAYTQGIYSSRRIARACQQRVDFMAVTALCQPDFRTLSGFRQRHREALAGLFVQVLRLCRRAGLVKLGHVALDGTKLRANASKHRAMSYERMAPRASELEAEVAAWFAAAEELDAGEDAALGADQRGDELPDWVVSKQQRAARIREAQAALEAEAAAAAPDPAPEADRGEGEPAPSPPPPAPKAQRNFTDPESKILKTAEGWQQGYNAQAAVDAESQVIVAAHVVACGSDRGELLPLVEAVQANLGAVPAQVSADAGYYSDANVRGLEAREVDGYLATGRQKHGAASATGDPPARESAVRAAMRAKLADEGWDSPYHLRKQTVEPVFGQIKAARGFRQFLTRGLANVNAEWRLVCCAHNVLKLAQWAQGG